MGRHQNFRMVFAPATSLGYYQIGKFEGNPACATDSSLSASASSAAWTSNFGSNWVPSGSVMIMPADGTDFLVCNGLTPATTNNGTSTTDYGNDSLGLTVNFDLGTNPAGAAVSWT